MIVNVIGLGATAKEFKPDGNICIGVNNAITSSFGSYDYQVCVDKPMAFNARKFADICSIGMEVKGFFTQLEEWHRFPTFRKINLKAVHAHNNRWNEFIPSSNNSPFVACGIAYKYFAATEIRLFGVDFNDHPNINGATREQAVKDFQMLQKILNEKGCRIIPHEKSYLYGKI